MLRTNPLQLGTTDRDDAAMDVLAAWVSPDAARMTALPDSAPDVTYGKRVSLSSTETVPANRVILFRPHRVRYPIAFTEVVTDTVHTIPGCLGYDIATSVPDLDESLVNFNMARVVASSLKIAPGGTDATGSQQGTVSAGSFPVDLPLRALDCTRPAVLPGGRSFEPTSVYPGIVCRGIPNGPSTYRPVGNAAPGGEMSPAVYNISGAMPAAGGGVLFGTYTSLPTGYVGRCRITTRFTVVDVAGGAVAVQKYRIWPQVLSTAGTYVAFPSDFRDVAFNLTAVASEHTATMVIDHADVRFPVTYVSITALSAAARATQTTTINMTVEYLDAYGVEHSETQVIYVKGLPASVPLMVQYNAQLQLRPSLAFASEMGAEPLVPQPVEDITILGHLASIGALRSFVRLDEDEAYTQQLLALKRGAARALGTSFFGDIGRAVRTGARYARGAARVARGAARFAGDIGLLNADDGSAGRLVLYTAPRRARSRRVLHTAPAGRWVRVADLGIPFDRIDVSTLHLGGPEACWCVCIPLGAYPDVPTYEGIPRDAPFMRLLPLHAAPMSAAELLRQFAAGNLAMPSAQAAAFPAIGAGGAVCYAVWSSFPLSGGQHRYEYVAAPNGLAIVDSRALAQVASLPPPPAGKPYLTLAGPYGSDVDFVGASWLLAAWVAAVAPADKDNYLWSGDCDGVNVFPVGSYGQKLALATEHKLVLAGNFGANTTAEPGSADAKDAGITVDSLAKARTLRPAAQARAPRARAPRARKPQLKAAGPRRVQLRTADPLGPGAHEAAYPISASEVGYVRVSPGKRADAIDCGHFTAGPCWLLASDACRAQVWVGVTRTGARGVHIDFDVPAHDPPLIGRAVHAAASGEATAGRLFVGDYDGASVAEIANLDAYAQLAASRGLELHFAARPFRACRTCPAHLAPQGGATLGAVSDGAPAAAHA